MSETATFVPCSPKHKGCTKAHSDLVWGYREERERQETALEELTGNGRGELEAWKDAGGQLITFKMWLKAHKRVERFVVPAEVIAVMAPLVAKVEAELATADHAARFELDRVVGW